MDEKKGNFPSNVVDQEMDIGDCSSEGDDEGEGDDEEEEDEELEEEIESVDDEDSEEEVIDEDDDPVEDSVSVISTSYDGNSCSGPSLSTPVYPDASPNYHGLEFAVDGENSAKKQTEVNGKSSSSPSHGISRLDNGPARTNSGEKKLAVKLKRFREGVYSFSDRQNDCFPQNDSDTDDRLKLYKEKCPGKVCALCNLGERSQLGQGEFLRVKKPTSFVDTEKPAEMEVASDDSKSKEFVTNRNKKSIRLVVSVFEPVDELGAVGHNEKINISDLFDEEGFIYIHSHCALFSREISRDSNSELENVIPGILKSLSRICSYCSRYGASVPCSFNNCDKIFHFPCSAASEGFQYSKNHAYICKTHVDHIPLLPPFNEVTCRSCYSLGNVVKLMMCSVCGDHYHTSCVGLASLPETRTGWQCPDCRICQVCREANSSSKLMLCGTCDKAYHANCLRPVLTSIPKIVWKCKGCRKCSDCGSRTPGSGLSSRWHHHFTVCDSCYQQRNKGFSCPVCHKAYRAGSSKEMTQCNSCNKFVHRTCDPAADPLTYQKKGETLADNMYFCQLCKNMKRMEKPSLKRKDGCDDSSSDFSMSASQESLIFDDADSETGDKDEFKFTGAYGLGKGKPLTARKKMALSSIKGFRSKYTGKAVSSGSAYQKKNQKITEFGRKRCTKSKIRGIFGAPGLGLQRPIADSQNKSDSDNGENKIILCSANDKFVLSQDVCTMCGALGTDQEGCLIACVQCGQCYHPYCVNVKVTKVILQKGWRCLDCTVCEGCGQRDDESRLILCDDCDISYHIYCMEPKLDSVPRGTWKCKWCAQCLTCGTNEPGIHCSWSKNYTECGPCSSRFTCPKCLQTYSDGDLIIKCDTCERWLHGFCDQLKTEQDAEKCAAEGYTCVLCRPEDMPPPHLVFPPPTPPACSTPKLKIRSISPVKSSECEFNFSEPVIKEEDRAVDGVYLSDSGISHLTSLLNGMDSNVLNLRKKKRLSLNEQGGDQGILESIESVIAAGVQGESAASSSSPVIYKEGMVIKPREDGKPPEPPEGFNIFTNESGIMVLRRKRIRKIGVGGFNARKSKEKNDEDGIEKESGQEEASSSDSIMSSADERPRKKKSNRKPKSKLIENYPSYIQDAFFGRELLDTSKDTSHDLESSDSDAEDVPSRRKVTKFETVTLSEDELKIMEEVKAKRAEMEEEAKKKELEAIKMEANIKVENEEKEEKGSQGTMNADNNNETFKDILNMSDNLLDTIMNEGESSVKTNSLIMDGLPNMDSKDVEDLFKNVLTDESQDSHDAVLSEPVPTSVSSGSYPISHSTLNTSTTVINNSQQGVIISQGPPPMMSPSHSVIQGNMNINVTRNVMNAQPPSVLPQQQNIPSPATYPSASPYSTFGDSSPSQCSPAFSEPPSPWVENENSSVDNIVPQSTNQKTMKKMEEDESLGENATMSSVLYANLNHPELKTEYPVWNDRYKQIMKKWKALPQDQKSPILAQARENRTKFSRGRKAHQEQEKAVSNAQKARESEKEKQWKRAQAAIRQHASSQQVHDSRLQNLQTLPPNPPQATQIRQTTSNAGDNSAVLFPQSPVMDSKTQLQISSPQDAVTSPTLTSPSRLQQRSFPSPVLKVTAQSPTYQRVQNSDVFTPPGTPRPQYFVTSAPQNTHLNARPVAPENDTYTVVHQTPEMSRHLRELLQGQQQIGANQIEQQPTQNRIWVQDTHSTSQHVPTETNTNQTFVDKDQLNTQSVTNMQTTVFENSQNSNTVSQPFRPPLPPSHMRSPRLSIPLNHQMLIRHKIPQQIVDQRLKLLIQQQNLMQRQHSQQQQLQPQQQNIIQPLFRQQLQQQQHHQQQQQPQSQPLPLQLPQQLQQQHQQLQHQSHLQQQQQQQSQLQPQNLPVQQRSPQPANIPASSMSHMLIPSPSAPQPKSSPLHTVVEPSYSEQAQNILNGNAVKEEFPHFAQRLENASRNVPNESQNTSTPRQTDNQSSISDRMDSQNEGIPESVAADLDALDREGVVPGNMSEMSALLGDLIEDEFFAEMGANFNILEYADPELDSFTSGEKTSILYDLVNSTSDTTKIKEEDDIENKTDSKPDDKEHNTVGESANVGFSQQLLESKNNEKSGPKIVNRSNEERIQPDIRGSVPTVESEFNSNENTMRGSSSQMQTHQSSPHLQQKVLQQLPRVGLRDGVSSHLIAVSSAPQLVQHPSPAGSQPSPAASTGPMTPRPPSSVTPGTPLTPATPSSVQPSTPLQSDRSAQSPISNEVQPQLPVITPAPPPPPYPGPPPPYPSQLKLVPQQIHHLSNSPSPNVVAVSSSTNAGKLVHQRQIPNTMVSTSQRPLLLQEQPLLLEDLVEQEKREQIKQNLLPGSNLNTALLPLSDLEFERLKADVLGGSGQNLLSAQATSQNIQPNLLNTNNTVQNNVKLATTGKVFDLPPQQTWQQHPPGLPSVNAPAPQVTNSVRSETQRISLFNTPVLQAPPEPPDNIVTEQDRQDQQRYEQWLEQQNTILEQQKKHYESEINKLRKSRKSINSKQRGLRKQGNELSERDAQELQRINTDMPTLQKYVESSRKSCKQHAALIQEYKNKHPNSSCLSDNVTSTAGPAISNTSLNVVVSSVGAPNSSVANVMISQQQKPTTSVVGTISRSSSASTVSQNQTEGVYTSVSQETLQTTLQSPMITSQIRANTIARYSNAPVRLVHTVRSRPGNVFTFQLPADGVRSAGPLYPGFRNTLKTQPLIVSSVSTSSPGTLLTSSPNISQANVFTVAGGPDKEIRMSNLQQMTPEQQQRFIIQKNQLIQQHHRAQLNQTNLNQANLDQNALIQRRRMVPQRPGIYPQVNTGPRVQQFAPPASPASAQNTLVPGHTYTLHSSSPSHYSQPPSSPMTAPSQSPRHVSQFVHPNSPVPSQSPQPPSSPMSMPSPRHVSQFMHPNSPAPPQSPIYASPAQYIPHTGSPIPARSPVLVRRSPSTESFIQENQSPDIHSGITYSQDSYGNGNANNSNNSNSGSNNNNNNNNTSSNNNSTSGNNNISGGGGNTISYVNAIPIPEEFVRLGIRPGLMGGSPAWNEKKETAENENYMENNNDKKLESDDLCGKPSTSSKSATSTITASQFYNVDDDVDSEDSSVFTTLPSKICLKSKSPNSPSDFEGTEFQSCATPKTSEDSIELPIYKDVTLDSCKSEENSLGIGDFASSMEDGEMPVSSLVIESGSLHLTLDSSDVRSDDFGDCLVSPNLLVLNVSEEHDGIMDDTSEIGQIFYFDKMDDDLNKNEGVIITDITDIKSEEVEEKSEISVNEEPHDANPEIKEEILADDDVEITKEVERGTEETLEEKPSEIENSVIAISQENSIEEHDDVKPVVTNSLVPSATAALPIRTTSVLQMTSSVSHSSVTKEANVTYSNIQLPVYIENFHSYVKKLPKTAENVTIKEESNIEKDKQLFDETLMKIKKENMNDATEEAPNQENNSSIENNKNVESEPSISNTTNTVQTSIPNSVITKEIKTIPLENVTQIKKENSPVSSVSQPVVTTSSMLPPRVRVNDDSQNVLLKQLLQNSNVASITHSTMTQHVTKPSPSPSPTYRSPPLSTTAEASIPTVSQTLTDTIIAQVSEPASLKTEDVVTSKEVIVSSVVAQPNSSESISMQISMSKSSPVSNSSIMSSLNNINRIQPSITNQITVPVTVVKQEDSIVVPRKDLLQNSTSSLGQVATPSPSTTSPMHMEIKKESNAEEITSPQSRTTEGGDSVASAGGDSSTGVHLDAQDLKKLKRRQYQAKRRQSQSKEHSNAVPKKRARKKLEDDYTYSYDAFIDSLMEQLRHLPPLPITEPILTHNYAVCLPLGSGDATKINTKACVNGELTGTHGSHHIVGQDDFYNTEPFGDEEPLSPSAMPSTNRFYYEEFSPLNLDAAYEEKRLEVARLERETETPDSVVSSSSPECIMPHTPVRFAGLRLIDENGSGVDSEEDERLSRRISPVIPLVAPLALRPRVHYQLDNKDKENCGKHSRSSTKSRHSPPIPLRDSGNLSVTLTLSSEAAQDIVGVLKNLATVLNIAPPASYKITDRIPSPNKINPFGNKYNDDVEEAELQTYFAGSIKHCTHCKIQISDLSSIKKKASEIPFVVQDGISEDLLFCSTSCYLQMLLLVPPVISEHKVSSSDDSILDPSPCKKPRLEKSSCSELMELEQTCKVTDSSVDNSDIEKSFPDGSIKGEIPGPEKKSMKGIKYRTWNSNAVPPPIQKFRRPTEKEMTETLFRMNITVMPAKMPEDMRSCVFCHQVGDCVADGPSRLLNYDVDKWAHLNCSLWSNGVYETVNGALMDFSTALQQGLNVHCTYCHRTGATLKCYKNRCSSVYHLSCAMKDECIFLKDKRFFCNIHVPKGDEDSQLTTLAVYRRVYIDRDENRQIASIVQHAELTHLMRIGSLIFLNVGQLLPHQLQEFHTANYIYPVGYKVIRFYWSMRVFNKRCQYVCSIHDVAGRPEFRILVQEPGQDNVELRGATPKDVWTRILEPLTNLRRTHNSVQIYPRYVSGEDLFGLTEPAIVRILENLPGIETLSDYRFKYGKNPLLELPLAVNPSGCARGEPRIRGPPHKRAFTQRTSSVMPRPVLTSSPLFSGDISCPYSKHFVHSKSSQYKKMKQEWRNYVYLARSKIQGLGLYAARDIDKHTMVIEYIGEIIRSQLSDFREKQYEAKNRGVYMFRLDENRVVDATICGGLARYINHSCNPNCVTEKVEVDREYRIIIFSKRKINRGEELSYDYQFDIEDDSQKIPCLCGAPNCRKWMN